MAVLPEPLKVRVSPSASVADTEPVTTPVSESAAPNDGAPATGAAFEGLITTATEMVPLPPRSSVAVTMKVSAF